MKRLIVVVAALAAALLVQLTIINGLPLPGGGVPDLVLLCVVAIGLVAGPRPGLIAGFCAGLALDLAPPSTELIGQYALVFCLVGYLSGRWSATLRSSAVAALTAAAGAIALGEVLVGILAVVLDTPVVTFAAVARVLPVAVIYDVVLSPIFMVAAVRIAVVLGVSFNPLEDSPAFEPGGSAAPMGAARLARLRQARHVGTASGIGTGGWLTGDSAASVPAVGAVGWLSGPARTRKARREQARLTAALTGAEPRKGAVWVGTRPAGLRPTEGAGGTAASSGLGRLRPAAGVVGSATREGLTGTAGGGRSATGAGLPKIAFGSGGSAGQATGRAADPGRPKIAFGTGSLPGSGRASGRGVPKIAFGQGSGGRPATQDPANGASTSKIAFGTGGLPGAGRASGRGVPRIRFGAGGLPGAGQARARRTPSIAFGSHLPSAPRTSPGRPALPRFSSGSARSASGAWLAGSRLRSARFGGGAAPGSVGGRRRGGFSGIGRRPKAARWGRKRRHSLWPSFLRLGGRSAIGRSRRQIGGER